MAKKAGARYLDSFPTVQNKTLRGRLSLFLATGAALLAILGTIFMGALVAYSSVETNKPVATNASALFNACGVIGQNMDGRSSWRANWDVALADKQSRRFTLSEVVPNSTWWSHFSGTNSDDGMDIFAGKWDNEVDRVNAGRDEAAQLPKTDDLPAELKGYRTGANCIFGAIPGTLGSFGLNFANFVTKISSFVATMSFNSSFICDAEGSAPGTPCIDLISIIGGRGNDAGEGGTGQGGSSGIIGNLTTGLYMPLMILVVLATALTVAWTGIVKRRYRDAFFQFFWLVGSTVIGLTLLLNPSLLVKAPMVAGNTVVGCVVGAFNGAGCGSGGSSATVGSSTPNAKENICVSSAAGLSPEQTATLYVNGMSCAIWSAFVLEPYAQGAFGLSVSQLDLDAVIDSSEDQTVRKLLESDGWNPPEKEFTPSSICVNLQAKNGESYTSMGNTFQGGDNTTNGTAGAVCNLAVWDLFMKTNAVGGGVTSANNNPDNQWLSVISRLPANTDMFHNYVDETGGWNKFGMGGLAALASLLGSGLIIFVSLLALVYYIIAIIMMAFAPVFFLFGMHPGRGRKIMLGWLEQVIGNILKYIISAVFLLIAVTFYGAILGATTNLLASIVFVVIVTIALILYRKELINLLSRVEMGGEKLAASADVMNKAKKFSEPLVRTGRTVTAGAIASKVTGSGFSAGAGAAVQRELRRGNGLAARTFQAVDAISKDNADDLYKIEQGKRTESIAAAKKADVLEDSAVDAVGDLTPKAADLAEARESEATAAEDNGAVREVIRTKGELATKVAMHFPESDYAARRADREVYQNDEDGNRVKVTSSEAYRNISNTSNQIDEARAAYAKAADLKDHGAMDEAKKLEQELTVKLNRDMGDFRQNHRGGGAASAFADIRQAENLFDKLQISRADALRSGDTEKAEAIQQSISSLDLQITSQRAVFDKAYGKDEYARADKEYTRATEEYIKHGADPEDKARFAEANELSYEKLNRNLAESEDKLQKARDFVDEKSNDYDEARIKASAKISAASEARTDADFLKAEVDSIAEKRKDFTPGQVISTKVTDNIQDKAAAQAGVQAGRNSEFNDKLKDAIKGLNDMEASGAGSNSEKEEISIVPTAKGENLRAAETRNPTLVARGDEIATENRIKAKAEEIAAADKAVEDARRRLTSANGREDLPTIERPVPGEPVRVTTAREEHTQITEVLQQTIVEKRVIETQFNDAKARVETISRDSNGERTPELTAAEEQVAVLNRKLSDITRAADTALDNVKDAENRFKETAVTPGIAAAQKAYENALAQQAAKSSTINEKVSIPQATVNSVQDNPQLVASLGALEARMNNLLEASRGGSKMSSEDRAKIIEVERRIAGLGENPSEALIKQITKLLPNNPAPTSSQAPAARAPQAEPREPQRSPGLPTSPASNGSGQTPAGRASSGALPNPTEIPNAGITDQAAAPGQVDNTSGARPKRTGLGAALSNRPKGDSGDINPPKRPSR